MNKQAANQMSLFNTLLTALIIGVSIYLIGYINSDKEAL